MSTIRYTTVNGEVLAEKRSGTRREYVPDPLGSTVALLDNTQAQTDTFSYWPYGEVNVRTGSTPTPFQFVGTAGYYQDSSSKSYVRARHLDTQKGRWLTQDPIGLLGGELNLYRYVDNRPVTLNDPLGKLTLFLQSAHVSVQCQGKTPPPFPKGPFTRDCTGDRLSQCQFDCSATGVLYCCETYTKEPGRPGKPPKEVITPGTCACNPPPPPPQPGRPPDRPGPPEPQPGQSQ